MSEVERKACMFHRMAWCFTIVISFAAVLGCAPEDSTAARQSPATRPATRPVATRPTTRPVHRDIQVEAFEKLWRGKKYAVLDVRTKAEFDAGHIPGAINIDVNDPQFEKKVTALEKDRPYLVNCRSGARSARACERMSRMGFEELYNLEGGIVAWQNAKKETTTE
jgi:rhodanese-related sulfurtransferase